MGANPLQSVLESLHGRFARLTDGQVATYIPELGRADPSHFGIALMTVDGHLYQAGDTNVAFTIQSIAKPFAYGLALDDRGADDVLASVGVEPSGDAFNAISLEPGSGRPRNPMINAGAIAVSSLVRGTDSNERWRRMLAMLSDYAGRPLSLDEAVFQSELETGHRNRAIGHLLRNAGIFDEDVDDVCGRYFRLCSASVTCEDLAAMAATLANGGVNPRTGARAIQGENVERVLSTMTTCGMYDAAGSWVYRVGMPAKSGVGGGILAVLPGQFGIAVFSPPLDAAGNSVRGVAVCEALSLEYGLHVLQPPVDPRSTIRNTFTLAQVPSKRRRGLKESRALETLATHTPVIQLQGSLVFGTVEPAIREAGRSCPPGGVVILDLKRITAMDRAVCRLLGMLAAQLAESGGALVFTPVHEEHAWAALILQGAGIDAGDAVRFFPDLDSALEWSEERALQSGEAPDSDAEAPPAEHPLLSALDADQRAAFLEVLTPRVFAAGERIISSQDTGATVFLISAGMVDVTVDAGQSRRHRLARLGAGASVGELALLDQRSRSANVDAATPVTCYEVSLDDIAAADERAPGLRLRLVEALARDLAERLRRANREIEALAT